MWIRFIHWIGNQEIEYENNSRLLRFKFLIRVVIFYNKTTVLVTYPKNQNDARFVIIVPV